MELGPFGLSELVFIAVMTLVLFGPKGLPDLARSAGRMVSSLRRATEELKRAFQAEVDAADKAAGGLREIGKDVRDVRDTLRDAGRDIKEEGKRLILGDPAEEEELQKSLEEARQVGRSALQPEPANPDGDPARDDKDA